MNKRGILGSVSVWGTVLVVAIGLMLGGCESELNSTGIDVIPDYLKGTPISKDFKVKLRTVEAGTKEHPRNIYVSSSKGFLGRMSNETFGGVESEYLTQFYIPDRFRFEDEKEIEKIDSVMLHIYYDGFTGDTIANMEVEVNRLTKPMEHNKYTITDISSYIGESLGKISYRAGRGSAKILDNKGAVTGYRLSIPLPTELGQEFFDRSKAGDPVFASQESFDQWFPGVYLHTPAGQGSVVRVVGTEMTFYYTKEVEVKDKDGNTKKENKAFGQTLIHTSEVPQLSRFLNHEVEKLLAEEDKAIIKAPAGLWVRAVIPTVEIAKELESAPEGYTRTLNAVTYRLQGEIVDQSATSSVNLNIPGTLLMLPRNRAEKFFEEELTEEVFSEAYSSFIAQLVVEGSTMYSFGNIGSVILQHIKEKPNEDLEVLIIPVERTTTQTQTGGVKTASVSHQVLPSAVKFAINDDNTKLEATIIERRSGQPF